MLGIQVIYSSLLKLKSGPKKYAIQWYLLFGGYSDPASKHQPPPYKLIQHGHHSFHYLIFSKAFQIDQTKVYNIQSTYLILMTYNIMNGFYSNS